MTSSKIEKINARLRVRGMDVSPTSDFRQMVPWTRLTFLLCGTGAAIGTALQSNVILGAMVPIALYGALMPRHPFDYLYNSVIRRFTGTIELPKNRAPTRFACGIASVWFLAIIAAFSLGCALTGYALGAMFVSVAVLVGTTHFCIPGTIYQFLFGDRSLIKPSFFAR